MKKRLTALALAGALLLALTACGPKAPAEDAVPSPDPTEESSLSPSVQPSDAPAVPPSDEPSAPPSDAPLGEPSPTPSAQPSPEGPVQTDPAQPEPSDAPAAAVPTAGEVYTAVSKAAGVSYDNASDYVTNFYTGLDTADLEDYALYMPGISIQIEEIFIARVKDGKMDAVKSACKDRQAAMAEEAAFYGTTGGYVDSYQLVTQGDWVLFCVCEKAADAVSAFQSAVK